ncbi:hypothetical protein EDB84DRAFT_1520100 [Lactarius hengduanensis]|nr:hypothetical protein EDB84DRAFT_1520100 [Lactarius hengduanensis]
MVFDPLTLLTLKYHGRSVAVIREHCLNHESLLAIARRTFPSLRDAGDIVLVAPIPGSPDTEPVELLPETWTTSELQSTFGGTTVCGSPVLSKTHLPGAETPSSLPSPLPPHPAPRQPRKGSRSFFRLPSIRCDPPVQSEAQQSSDVLQAIIISFPAHLSPAPASFDISEPGLLGKKVSRVYELIDPQAGYSASNSDLTFGNSPLTWTVAAEPDGTLVDRTSGMEVSYLYWEAIATPQPMTPGASRATTPIVDIDAFDPARPSVNPGESVLLPTSKVPGYLDVALKALALHTEARTSFITYWLPDMLKHEYVALRFVAQDAYERTAPMRIAPAPDVVTRVFMLFRGVPVGDLGLWEAARARAAGTGTDGARSWPDVVGVDTIRAADSGLFRVLEWGGMEVR